MLCSCHIGKILLTKSKWVKFIFIWTYVSYFWGYPCLSDTLHFQWYSREKLVPKYSAWWFCGGHFQPFGVETVIFYNHLLKTWMQQNARQDQASSWVDYTYFLLALSIGSANHLTSTITHIFFPLPNIVRSQVICVLNDKRNVLWTVCNHCKLYF